MKLRTPAVAGRFYPSNPEELRKELEDYAASVRLPSEEPVSRKLLGGVVPHAGYFFSGSHAMHFMMWLKASGQLFDTFVIVNPNHTGYGAAISLDDFEAWQTPFGKVEVDTELREALPFKKAPEAHSFEHSGEVMLPMLQFVCENSFRILPVTLTRQDHHHASLLAGGITEAAGRLNRRICWIASSDFSHYLPPETGYHFDQMVIDRILSYDINGVEETVRENDISVCGFGPIMSLMAYSQQVAGKPEIKILSRGHSGEKMESDQVVDYVSMVCLGDRI
ncbi:MAG: MEMO1 family protein [Bacteroidales bacterium]